MKRGTVKRIGCTGCEIRLTPDEIALCMRLFGRGTAGFYCLACLAKRLGTGEEELRQRIDYFKRGGCELFEKAAGLEP